MVDNSLGLPYGYFSCLVPDICSLRQELSLTIHIQSRAMFFTTCFYVQLFCCVTLSSFTRLILFQGITFQWLDLKDASCCFLSSTRSVNIICAQAFCTWINGRMGSTIIACSCNKHHLTAPFWSETRDL